MAQRRANPKPPFSRRHDSQHPHWELLETICMTISATMPTAVLEAALDRWERS